MTILKETSKSSLKKMNKMILSTFRLNILLEKLSVYSYVFL